MEHKYIIHLIFQQPSFNDGQINLINKTTSFGYNDRKSAKEAYDKFNRRQYIEMSTPSGMMTFNLLSVEFLDIKRYEKFKLAEEEEVNKDGNGNTEDGSREDGSEGIINDADNEESSRINESETE